MSSQDSRGGWNAPWREFSFRFLIGYLLLAWGASLAL
jgi:hypothetical protein